jgi:ATP phosphoribosyltransferase regulatory subunit
MTILKTLEATGCMVPEIDLLQPADPFLDTTGEDLRRRIFITQENSGKQFCLRPEFTIPVCIRHLEKGWIKGRYAYCGKVFRQRGLEGHEFTQAGFENLGSDDTNDADIDCIQTALHTLEASGQEDLSLVLGDQAIFVSALEALRIPQAWRKKLIRAFGDDDMLKAQLDQMSSDTKEDFDGLSQEIRDALEARELTMLENAIKGEMLEQGLPLSGGRTPRAIAERLIEKAELASEKLDSEKRSALEEFLGIDVELSEAHDTVEAFELKHGIMLTMARDELYARAKGLKGSKAAMRYKASFGRRLDYYTGFVFEIFGKEKNDPLVGGGRYDKLMTLLGSPYEIPAVGFAVWVDRLVGDVS